MNALIHITEREGQQAVDARELHSFLESKQEFAHWIRNRIKVYGLTEGRDYMSFETSIKRVKGGTTRKDYALTITCAKELAMVEGNKKGKAARLYFIECERRLQTSSLQQRVTVLEATVVSLQRQLSGKHPAKARPLALSVGTEALLVQKHFAPAPAGSAQGWTVQQVIDFLCDAERVKSLNRIRIGTALSRLCGARIPKWTDNKSMWYYSATLTA